MPTLPELQKQLADLDTAHTSDLKCLASQEKVLVDVRRGYVSNYTVKRDSLRKQIADLSRPAIGKRVKNGNRYGIVIARPGLSNEDFVYIAYDDFTWNGYLWSTNSHLFEVLP